MDLSLYDYMEHATNIYNTILHNGDFLSVPTLRTEIDKIELIIKNIQHTLIKITGLYNICKQKIQHRIVEPANKLANYNNAASSRQHLQILDHTLPPSKWPNIFSKISNISIKPDIVIPAKVVQHLNQVPNINIYWVTSIQQFVLKINNTIIRGDIGDVYKRQPSGACGSKYDYDNLPSNIKACIKCKNTPSKGCIYYHDPLKYGYNPHINKTYIHNFMATSWLTRPRISRSTYKLDIEKIKMNNDNAADISMLQSQMMHDLLSYIIIISALA